MSAGELVGWLMFAAWVAGVMIGILIGRAFR